MRIKDLPFSIRQAVIKESFIQNNEPPSLAQAVVSSFVYCQVPISRFKTLQTQEQVVDFWVEVIHMQNWPLFHKEYIFTLKPEEYKTISVGEEIFNI